MEKDWMKEYEQKQQEALKEAKNNLKNYCKLLEPKKITTVQMNYDGCGDSGAIEEIIFYCGDKEFKGKLPQNKFKSTYGDNTVDLKEALEEMSYQFLPDGWEINEGSFGTLKIDVKEKSIKVEHNQRYEEVNYSEEEFKL